MPRAAPAGDGDVGVESARAVEAVRRPIALAEAGSERLEGGRQKIVAAHDRLMWWINAVTAVLAALLVWMAAGQLSLLIHGWKLVRR